MGLFTKWINLRCAGVVDSRLIRILLLPLIGTALLSLFVALLAACGRQSAPVDIYAPYRPAIRAEHQPILDELAPVPRYDLVVDVDVERSALTGTAKIIVPNTSSAPWDDLYFRLYPSLKQYSGAMTVHGALVDGLPTTFGYVEENSAIRLTPSDPILPGNEAEVELAWRLSYPAWPGNPEVYALFGEGQSITSLPLFYPSLAVFEEGPISGTGRWWLEKGDIRGDAAYNLASLFVVTATLAADQVPVTSGTLITTTLLPDGARARHVWVTGPSREFLLHFSNRFRSAQQEAYGTRVTSYWLPEQEAAGRAALGYAAGALRLYSELFGPFPYRDMRIAPATLSYRGMEYPQVNLLGVEIYDRYREDLETLVAHEVAHQWWYNMVHNDPVRTPWLDEALAEFSMKLYIEALYGQDDAEIIHDQRWQLPLDILIAQGEDTHVSQPVVDFVSAAQYQGIVYGKGALFYDAMYKKLGARAFRRFLQDYYEKHRYGIVSDKDWAAALKELNDPELLTLYEDWIKGRGPPEPTPEPTETVPSDADTAWRSASS